MLPIMKLREVGYAQKHKIKNIQYIDSRLQSVRSAHEAPNHEKDDVASPEIVPDEPEAKEGEYRASDEDVHVLRTARTNRPLARDE